MNKAPIILTILFTLLLTNHTQADVYRYQDASGVWHFTDDPNNLPGNMDSPDTLYQTEETINYDENQTKLTIDFPARNAVEKAIQATVLVESPIGSGTGFFITSNGHIITNRHVLRGNEKDRKKEEEKIAKFDEDIRRIDNEIRVEEERIDNYRDYIRKKQKQIDDMPKSATKSNYEHDLKLQKEELRNWVNNFSDKVTKYREEKRNIQDNYDAIQSGYLMSDISNNFKITLADKRTLSATLITISENYDLALLKIDHYETPFLKPGNSKAMQWGSPVFALGNPINLRNSAAKGVLSGFQGDYIKTDAKIYPGNSGGPLVDKSGHIIGINTFKEITHKFEGLGFAIDIRIALDEFSGFIGTK